MTSGRTLLLRYALPQVLVAKAIGVSRPLVGYWLSGERVPSLARRVALEELLGIPVSAWEKP